MTQSELLENALAAHMRGELATAEALYLQVLHADAPSSDALFLLASLYLQQNNALAAKPLLEQLVQQQPAHHEGWMQLAETYRAGNEFNAALSAYTRAYQLRPDNPHAVEGIADCLLALERPLEALPLYQAVIPLLPADAVRYRSMGNALLLSNQAAAAEAWYQQSLQLQGQDARTWNDLGVALLKQNRLDEAGAAFEHAFALAPNFPDALFNRGFLALLQGDFAAGWSGYEWRRAIKGRQPPNVSAPEWLGEPLAGKILLVKCEQGFGDTFQFARYIQVLREQGAEVWLECQSGLLRVLQTIGANRVFEQTEGPTDGYDYYCWLLSIPSKLGVGWRYEVERIPYMHADSAAVQEWGRLLSARTFNIGFVWAGRSIAGDDRSRRCTFAQFQDLFDLPGVHWYSLQKGPEAAEFQLHTHVSDMRAQLHDFSDTAALISRCDLVITIDTAVAHLAGALGKPVWTALAFAPDWRWQLVRQDSPWYPSMRLFRQSVAGQWLDVFVEIRAALQQQLAQHVLEKALRQFAVGNIGSATLLLEELLQWQPNAESVWNNLGVMYKEQKRYADAAHALHEAVHLAPDYSEAWNNLGNVYWVQHRAEEALLPYRKALELNPENAVAWNNLGNCLQAIGQVDEAVLAFGKALRLDPEFAMAHWNFAIASLLQRDYRNGWREYEWGLRCGLRPLKFQPLPVWQGDEEACVLVYAEQGFGDTLQFIRFIRLFRERVADVGLAVPPELLTLLQRALPDIPVLLDSAVQRQNYDAVLPLMSLPERLGLTRADELTISGAYLLSDEKKSVAWQQNIARTVAVFRLGILWQGNRRHQHDSLRSIAPDVLLAALSSSATEIHSLQAGQDAPAPPHGVFDWRSEIKDFDDLAAIVSALDCVVTVDTAVAHLAGALGKSVYVLLPYAPDWRWGRHGGNSEWYPTMHLLRQTVSGDWNGPLAELKQQLQKIIKKA